MELFPPKVKLRDSDHTYWHENGEQYMSFSELFAEIGGSFEANKIAYFVGGKTEVGMNAKLSEWEEKRKDGVRVDNALTHYLKHGEVPAEFNDMNLAIIHLGESCYDYAKVLPQQTLFNEDYRTAGTCDNLCLTTNRKDAGLVLSDTKCYEKMEEDLYKGRGWLKAPFEHLPNSKFIKTAFQLSYYGHHAEKLTGKKIKELFIHLIQPSTCKNDWNVNHKKIAVPYLKHDIEIFLETFKDKIKEKLTNKNKFVI